LNSFFEKIIGRGIRSAALGIAALVVAFVQPISAKPASPELATKIDRLFAEWDHPDTPGVIVAISLDGETIFSRGYGMANLEHGIPMTPETVTESGSVAKQFTASAVVLLAQRGKLSLDDPIRKYLPELPPELADGIKIRMLLNHTSGLRNIHGLFDLLGRPSYSAMHDDAEVLRVMSRQRQLNFVPGAEYLYCNSGYVLASIIVQRASGQSFEAYCEENIFRPHA
jgi:CubicO group peptidase (beta-lactamase class C family)